MDRETAKKLLPIITAFAEGKVIERKDSDGLWYVLASPGFCGDPENYRIKPEPKEIWVNEYSDAFGKAHTTKEKAENAAKHATGIVRKAVRFVEAVED